MAPQVIALGRPRVHLRRTASTSDRARELAIAGAPHGTLVTASEQTAGRGRQGRRWLAPPGEALLMSLVLRSSLPACVRPMSDRSPAPLPLLAAVAVCDAAGEHARVKWPNDIVVRRGRELRKLAGILTEGRPQEGWAVLGVGLNVAVRLEDLPPELRESAATLGLAPSAIEPIMARVLDALERRLSDPAEAIEDWRALDALRGREVSWTEGDALRCGRGEGIDGSGRLLVTRPDGGCAVLDAGEVRLRDARSNSP